MILLLCFLAYIPVFKNGYVTDDFTVHHESQLKKPKNIWDRIWKGLKQTGYWGRCDKFAHAVNLAVHYAVCIAIYYAFGKNEVSYLAACLFAINPIGSEVSLWLSGRHYGYQALLAVLAWLNPFIMLWTVCISFLLPRFTCALTFFPLLYLTRSYPVSLLATASLLFLWNMKYLFNPKEGKLKLTDGAVERLRVHPKKLIIAIKFYGYNFINGIFAFHTASYIGYMRTFAETKQGQKESYNLDRYFWIGCALLYVLLVNLIWIGPSSLAVLGLLWYTITIAMWCNFVNIGNMQVAVRYNYLPNVGLMVFVASILVYYPMLSGILLGWYFAKLLLTLRYYKNDYWHSLFQIVDEPDLYYSWLLHGNMMFSRRNFNAAIQDYVEGLSKNEGSFHLHYNMSSCYIALKDYSKAIVCLENARKCTLIDQEKSIAQWVEERQKLIGNCIEATKRGYKIELTLDQIPIIV